MKEAIKKANIQAKETSDNLDPIKIIVYGTCDDDGESGIFSEMPFKSMGIWLNEGERGHIVLEQKNLFSKNHPERLKIISQDKKRLSKIHRQLESCLILLGQIATEKNIKSETLGKMLENIELQIIAATRKELEGMFSYLETEGKCV